MNRYLSEFIKTDLERKMVLLSGPRQVGKTTLARNLPYSRVEYFNYDADEDRIALKNKTWRQDTDLLIFDELHKQTMWKRWLKGIYDKQGIPPRILVTGSARLDTLRRGGESLAGRYFPYRLHPFSVKELAVDRDPSDVLNTLLILGGFPEPFMIGSEEEAARWRRTHVERIIREDLLDLEYVQDIRGMLTLVDLLSRCVGSSISYDSLANDLAISPHTVKRWVDLLETLYVIFIVKPYTKRITRSLQKRPKIYFYDTGFVKGDEGARLENLVACALLKHNHFLEDTKGQSRRLCYLRDRQKREVDFCVVTDDEPEMLIEVKVSQPDIKSLQYFASMMPSSCRLIHLSLRIEREFDSDQILVRRAAEWLATLAA